MKLQMLSTQIQEQITERSAAGLEQARNRRLLRSRQGDPVHDQTEPRHPRHHQQRQGEGRSGEGSAGKGRLAGELEKGRREILERPDDESQRRPAAGAHRRIPGTRTAQSGDLRQRHRRSRRPGRSSKANYVVIEVEKLNPEKVQTLAEVEAQIKTQLTQQVAPGSLLRIRRRLPEQVDLADLLRRRLS